LSILLEKPGEVVTREEMRQRLWPSDTFVDFEHGLNSAIKKLRAALGDSPENSRYIETLPRVGYRFIAPIQKVTEKGQTAAAGAPIASDSGGVLPVGEKSSRPRWPVLLGIAVVLIAALGAYFQWNRTRARPQPSSGRLMLAVLPFENLTGDAGQDYFSDGLTEEMIAQLGRLDPERLGVIARTSVMHYKHTQEQLDRIGGELGVQYVMEGSVRRDGDKVRITAQLTQTKDQTRVWARQYDRELSNLLVLQGEIAQDVSSEIHVALGNQKRVAPVGPASLSPEAFEVYALYLEGRYFWNKRTALGFERAIGFFQQAVAKDPSYARAYAGLADSYTLMSSYNVASPKEMIPRARAAALTALQLDEGLAEAHASLAVIAQNYDWDWQTAEKEYRRAIQLDPNYATAHHWYAEYLALRGRFDEALAEIERARQLDPLSLIIGADRGAILYYSRQYDRAIEQFRTVLEIEPNFSRAHIMLYAYVQKGQFADALADIEKWRHMDNTPWTWTLESYVCGRSGQLVRARHAFEKLQKLNRHQPLEAALMFVAYVGMGDKDKAFAWLQKAYLEHSPVLTALKVDPIYDPLRSDPRFQDLLRRVGLASNGTTGELGSKP
jgi:TolB-like protein/Tfp pilus assembly protein PilF